MQLFIIYKNLISAACSLRLYLGKGDPDAKEQDKVGVIPGTKSEDKTPETWIFPTELLPEYKIRLFETSNTSIIFIFWKRSITWINKLKSKRQTHHNVFLLILLKWN